MMWSRIGSLSQRIFVYVVVVVGVALSVLSFLPLPQYFSLLPQNMFGLTVGVLSVILGITIEGHRQQEKNARRLTQTFSRFEQRQKDDIKELISTLAGGAVVSLPDTVAVYRYVTERIKIARREVCDLSWGPSITTLLSEDETAAYVEYSEAKRSAVNRGIDYKEVWTLPDNLRKDRYRAMRALNRVNYQARYYPLDHQTAPPLMNFVLVDDELIIAFYSGRDIRGNPDVHLATSNELIRKLFQGYYNAIWQQAKKLDEQALNQADR